MKKLLLFSLLVSYVYASEQKYTISVCTTQSLKNAEYCKIGIQKSMQGNVFIIKESDSRFYTYLNLYEDKKVANIDFKNLSQFVKKQKPYIKKLNSNNLTIQSTVEELDEKNKIEEVLKIDEPAKSYQEIENPKVEQQNVVEEIIDDAQINNIPTDEKIIEDVVQSNENSNLDLKTTEHKETSTNKFEENLPKAFVSNVNLNEFDKILVKVNSKTNIMELKGVQDSGIETLIRTYIVATARPGVKKPQGVGNISAISLSPYWYPTPSIKKSFAKKGINLPNVVPPNHKYNYMGAAKLNLTHSVNGDTSYRIHGTLNENTLGKNVSAGCIRMKNSEIVELTKALQKIDLKKITVDLF